MYWISVTAIINGNGNVSKYAYDRPARTGPFTSRENAERAMAGLLSAGRVVGAEIEED